MREGGGGGGSLRRIGRDRRHDTLPMVHTAANGAVYTPKAPMINGRRPKTEDRVYRRLSNSSPSFTIDYPGTWPSTASLRPLRSDFTTTRRTEFPPFSSLLSGLWCSNNNLNGETLYRIIPYLYSWLHDLEIPIPCAWRLQFHVFTRHGPTWRPQFHDLHSRSSLVTAKPQLLGGSSLRSPWRTGIGCLYLLKFASSWRKFNPGPGLEHPHP